jgi:outer membrane murein-binding lipoprotein Lpp
MMRAPYDSRRRYLVRATLFVVLGFVWMTGCAGRTSELKQEIEVLLKQAMDEVRQETDRIDSQIAHIRSEVVQLRSEVGQVDSKVGRLRSQVGQLGSEVMLLQTEVQRNDTTLVDLAIRVNQLDQHVARNDKPSPPNGEHTSGPSEAVGRQPSPPVATAAVSSQPAETLKGLQHGMSQQDVLRLFGNPHEIDRVLDSIYWYYGDGEMKGGYVRFDALNGRVNGSSTFAPQHFQIDLHTIHGR